MRKSTGSTVMVVVAAVLLVGLAFSERLEAAADRMTILKADGMSCGRCAATVTGALEKEPGVSSVSVEVAAGTVAVGYDSKVVTPETLATRVTASGYQSRVMQVQALDEQKSGDKGSAPARVGCSCCNKDAGNK